MFLIIKRECTVYVQAVGVVVRKTTDEKSSSGDFLPTFRDNLSVSSSVVWILDR